MSAKPKLRFIPNCPLSKLRPFEGNPRRHEAAIEAIVKSIKEFEFINPIIVDSDYRICAGHARYKAATELGVEKVPVLVAPQLVGEKFLAYNIADNQTASLSEWDEPKLVSVVGELREGEYDLAVLGLSDARIEEIMAALDGADFDPEPAEFQGRLDQRTAVTCPNCGAEFIPR